MIEAADSLLDAFARSDVEALDRLCADDVLVWGTDAGEEWSGKAELLAAFEGAFDLQVAWTRELRSAGGWVAGEAEFTLADGTHMSARVTMLFGDGLLVHAHYSTPAEP